MDKSAKTYAIIRDFPSFKKCLKSTSKSIKKSIAGKRFVFVSLYMASISFELSNIPKDAKIIAKAYINTTAGISLKIFNDVFFSKRLKEVAKDAKKRR